MKRKLISKSAFFTPRFLTGFAFCLTGVFLALLVFARPGKPGEQQNQPPVQPQDIPTLNAVALPVSNHAIGPIYTIKSLEGDYLVDLTALDIHPTQAPLPLRALAGENAGSPEGSAMGTGKAFMGITHEVVNQNIATGAFGVLSSGWTAGESVQVYANGVLALTAAANADGIVAVNFGTGAGFGFITIEEIGLTSGKDTGGALQVAPTGPYVPGVAGAPHAINTTASAHFYLYGFGYPVSTVVPLYRNGVFLGNVTTSAAGRFFVTVTPANSGDTSANYSADTVGAVPTATPTATPTGSPTPLMGGVSLEERADAGTPPVGDQNNARVFFDRATLNSATGGVAVIVGEGFEPGEPVTISGCALGSLGLAGAEGQAGAFLSYPGFAGISPCLLTGGTTGRVARGTVLLNPDVRNLRGLISLPAFVTRAPVDVIPIAASKLPPNDTGNIYLDGVFQGTATTNANGYGQFNLFKPMTGFVHAVSRIAGMGARDA